MKIEKDYSIVDMAKITKDATDPFDIDFKVNPHGGEEMKDHWTSKSICTPGCTNGTGNSYCCTCK